MMEQQRTQTLMIAGGLAGLVLVLNATAGLWSWAMALLGLMVAVWLWLRRDSASRRADDAASEALDAAEKSLRQATRQVKIDIQEVTAPAAETPAPVAETPAPVAETPAPVAETPAPVAETPASSAETPAPAAETPVSAPAPDDLTRIEGIGPRYRDLLAAAGITTYDRLAATPADQLSEIIKAATGRKPASVATWAQQAALAARGDWDALAALQQSLTGGRKA
jgi:predicted flap endonuclease-1-like 5' DNA nuclease